MGGVDLNLYTKKVGHSISVRFRMGTTPFSTQWVGEKKTRRQPTQHVPRRTVLLAPFDGSNRAFIDDFDAYVGVFAARRK